MSGLAKCFKFYVKVFYVMGKGLTGELSYMMTGLVSCSPHHTGVISGTEIHK